jgi:hypothetical protein
MPKDYTPLQDALFADKLRIADLLACRIDELFRLAADPSFAFFCTVTQDSKTGSETALGTMQFLPAIPPDYPSECLSALLTPDGTFKTPTTGFIELQRPNLDGLATRHGYYYRVKRPELREECSVRKRR